MSEARLLVTSTGGIKRIIFNRPARRNPIDRETFVRLRAAIAESKHDDTRVIVLTGAGEAFCAGADLSEINITDAADYDVTQVLREHANQTILTMRSLPIPIIARVHGAAAGVGCNYALACDLIIASEKAVFVQAFAKIGLMPDGGGTFFLPRLVGYHKAFELMATGDVLTAAQALQFGMVNRVTSVAELDDTVTHLAERLSQMPPIALAKIKAALQQSANADLATMLEFEAVNQRDCFNSQDFIAGVTAFLQKRKPTFTGR